MLIQTDKITILQDRQRKEIDSTELMDLATSINKNGLIHAVVIRASKGLNILVAGERRLRAVQLLSEMGDQFTYGGIPVPLHQIPAVFIQDLDPLDAMEIELDENIKRTDLSWQDRCTATARLTELRTLQADRKGVAAPTTSEIAAERYPDHHPNAAHEALRKENVLAKHLHDPDVAAARSMDEGIKVIRRKEEARRSADLGKSVGVTFSNRDHQLFLGDCLNWFKREEPSQFDCILTDPPYGINAQDFNDSGGKASATGHTYDDSLDNWRVLMLALAGESFRLAKPQAHLYCFCDVDNFHALRDVMRGAGWKVFRTPLVWHNPTSQRAPWPQHGPHRRYQLCLYAVKGDRPVLKLSPDLVTYASDENLGWAAQKPVGLLVDLLNRTCRPGDRVLDPFAGSGSIFPAAHGLKIRATGVETDPVAYGIAVKRIGELK